MTTTLRLLLLSVLLVMQDKHPKGPLVLDCTNDPPCPDGEVCSCKTGTYHPRPYFTVDDRDGYYRYTIGLVGKWECWPSDGSQLKDVKTFTVMCYKSE
jgi:hypothetical protein